ncbi:hypothetical protein SCB49_02454 [unidentified eubacterium SCB49]|nr:hypothetical protein SCB49_02454 [unidentified eubacterium SCB49]
MWEILELSSETNTNVAHFKNIGYVDVDNMLWKVY